MEHGTYQINPHKAGNLHYDDWHEGFGDCVDKIFPQHIGNKAYMNGWFEGLGMQAGYENLPASVDCDSHKSFADGYQNAQYERHCKCKETLLKFDD